MLPSNLRSERGEALRQLRPSQFETYDDYYQAIHLNQWVRISHVVGMLIACCILATLFYTQTWWLILPYMFLIIGVPQLAHLAFDSFYSPAARDSRGSSLFMALRLNFGVMFGLQRARDRQLLAKYPFVADAYRNGRGSTSID